ncbi:hypothetical protein [Nonomuraea sp. NPDC048901]|uniref:hypothetical protein n=1 Tax=Nonomuraea sp. NPDC048901 TaxID=3155627 RepID=UPI0033C87C75
MAFVGAAGGLLDLPLAVEELGQPLLDGDLLGQMLPGLDLPADRLRVRECVGLGQGAFDQVGDLGAGGGLARVGQREQVADLAEFGFGGVLGVEAAAA